MKAAIRTKSRTRLVDACALAFVLFALPCQQAIAETSAPIAPRDATRPASPTWDAYVGEVLESYFRAQPSVAVWAGRHEFDGKLPDWSARGITREIKRLHVERARTLRFKDASLDERQRVERDYLVATMDDDLFWLEAAEWPFRSPDFYSFSLAPNVYILRDYAPLAERMRAYTKYARAIPAAARQIRKNLRAPLPRTYVQLGHITFGGLETFYKNEIPVVFAPVTDPRLQANFRSANAGAIKAMKDLDAWLTRQEAAATDKFALGPVKFLAMLKATERVDVPLPQLEQIAQRDLDRNLAALRDACGAFAPGQSVAACVAKEEADKQSGSPIEVARSQLAGLRSFIEARGVVTIPGAERAKVEESPPYARWNFASIDIPGPYENNLPSIYYISPPDPKWTKAEQDAYVPGKASLLFTSVHEVWPGHFVQFMHAKRSPSKWGQVFGSYAFREGWAHYAEELMWESGLNDGDPETHIGQLLNALLRNVRLLSAIGMHAGRMTAAESEAMFLTMAYQDPGNARQQAARGTFDPSYGSYTIGKLMIRKLREDWTATRGGRQAWKAFHDELLKYGAPPIPLVRKALLGENTDSLF